jgi:ATP-dependent Clp protease ATP-binding subunit ClpX
LTQPKNAVIKQYNALLNMEGVELEVTPEALKAMSEQAIKRKTGARGLRSVIESVLLDTMYELPSVKNIAKVIIDADCVNGKHPPVRVERQVALPLAKAA